ncbi:MAG: DUF2950 family protein [Candidatus Schekmanbacteria bacterium]|nr:DUF2950 family protein [Candidatus Schekmanbacteria bacterium]
MGRYYKGSAWPWRYRRPGPGRSLRPRRPVLRKRSGENGLRRIKNGRVRSSIPPKPTIRYQESFRDHQLEARKEETHPPLPSDRRGSPRRRRRDRSPAGGPLDRRRARHADRGTRRCGGRHDEIDRLGQLDDQQGTDRHCYAASLAELDAGINGVGLISHQLATGQQHGYRFALAPGSDGCKSYVAVAVPLQYGVSGVRSFFADQSGVVRGADLGGEPAAVDTPAVP